MFTEQQFSPRPFASITAHTHDEHKKLYAGYVKNANTVLEKIASYQGDETKVYELGELYRHFSFEWNGMCNHECYFALLQGQATALATDSALAQQIEKQWGSFEKYLCAYFPHSHPRYRLGNALLRPV